MSWTRRVVAFSVAVGALPVAAAALSCSTLLGIVDVPLRDGAETSADALGIGPGLEASVEAACGASDGGFCARQCPRPDFCDDFEGESQDFPRWSGGPNLPNRLITLEGGLAIVPEDASANGQVFVAEAFSSTDSPSVAVLVHELKAAPREGRGPRGLRLLISAKLTRLSFDEPDGAFAEKYFYFFAGADGRRNEGVALALLDGKPGQFEVTLQQREIRANGKQINLVRVVNIDQVTLERNYFGFELIIGSAALLAELKQPCNLVNGERDPIVDAAEVDGAPPDGLRVVARFGIASVCVALHDELALGDWLSDVTLIAGVTVAGHGNAASAYDDIAATFLW